MDERPFPHGPLPQAPPSRRGVLVAGVVTLAAAGGGVALGLATGHSEHGSLPAQVSRELTAAAAAERARIASVRVALRTPRGRRAELQAIASNHAAHLAAIEALIADARYPDPSPSTSAAAAPVAGPVTPGDVRTAEQDAARSAAARATRLSGRAAALLATIAACEASHVELLT